MAEAIDPETSLQRAVGCAVCFESMVDSRTLVPCMHTFCAECVRQMKQQIEDSILGILCPLCRTFIAQGNIRSNQFVNSVIELIVLKESGDKPDENQPECVQCGSINIVARCLHCNDNLCSKCKNRHLQMKGYQDHELVSLEEAKNKQMKNVTVFCSKHPSRQIERNCVPCKQVVCAECLYDDHNGHKSENIDKALNRIRPEVRRAIVDITVKNNDRKAVIKSMKETNDKMSHSKSNIIEHLTKHKDKIIKQFVDQVNKEYEDLVFSFDLNFSSKSKELELSRNDIENSVVSDESLVAWILTILDKTDGGGLLRELQSGLMTRIQQIQKHSYEDDVKPSPPKLHEFFPVYPKHSQPVFGEIKVQEDPNVKIKISCTDVQSKEDDLDKKQGHTSTKPKTSVKNIKPKDIDTGTKEAPIIDNQTVQSVSKSQYGEGSSQVTSNDNEQIRLNLQQTSMSSINSKIYRFSKIKLGNLLNKHWNKVKTVKLKTDAQKLCVFKDHIWVPRYRDNSITVMSLDGSVQRRIKLASITYPRSLHPLNSNQLILAAGSGLYILDCDGQVQEYARGDSFYDVHVHKHLVAAMTLNKVYVYDVSNEKWTIKDSFDITQSIYCRTIHIRDPYIYISGFNHNPIQKYSMTGEHLDQLTGHSVSLFNSRLCMSDDDHNLLVGSSGNELTVITENGSVVASASVQVDSYSIKDALILDNTLYVLDSNKNITLHNN